MEADVGALRLRANPWTLIRHTMGGPNDLWHKAKRFLSALRGYFEGAHLEQRLERLRALGYIEILPSRVQLFIGAIDMLRFWIVPAATDYYQLKRVNFAFHQVLRFLDEPASLIDPTGFMSTRDNIIGHVMQVVHANPIYDFQLLESFEDGLDEMERQLAQMLEGIHPRTCSIRAIVEDPDYHARLLVYLQAYRKDKTITSLLRENVEQSPALRELDAVFGTLPAAMRYFAALPTTWRGGLRHLVRVRKFARALPSG